MDESFEDLLSKYKQIQLELDCIRKAETMALEPAASPVTDNAAAAPPAEARLAPEPTPELSLGPVGEEQLDKDEKKVFQAFNIKPLRHKLPTPAELDELQRKSEGQDTGAKQAVRKQQLRTWKLQQQRKQEETRRQEEDDRRKREEEIRRIRDLSNQDEQYNRFMKLVGGKRTHSRSRDQDYRKCAGKPGLDTSGNLYQYDNYDEVAMDTDSETSSPDETVCYPPLGLYGAEAAAYGMLPRHKSVVVSLKDSDDSDSDLEPCSSSQTVFGGLEFMIKEVRRTVEATKPKTASGCEKENNPVRTPETLPEAKKAEYRLLKEEIAR
ncbi:hypothetical protein GOODEAATRI_008283 [Goodea atripinnis]|uniref:Uncharacterized protein n=1 Tax=Goodea atripinnis TaxID=208336 RepID=A0ABV0P2N3_9TELE